MRFLNGLYLIDVKNARLNGSSAEVDRRSGDAENTTYTKKIWRGKESYPYASGQNQKYNIKRYFTQAGFSLSPITATDKGNQSISEGNPAKYIDEDILGFMNASKAVLTEEEYAQRYQTTEEQKLSGYKRGCKKGDIKYEKNVTKKRKGRLQISALQAITPTRVTKEFCIKSTEGDNNLYSKEVYSCIMEAGFNLDVSNVGVYRVSEDTSGFRDYQQSEVDVLIDKLELIQVDDSIVELSKEQRFERIKAVLESIVYMSIGSCQGNNLVDVSPKLIILADYSWGNNLFIDVFDKQGNFDVDYFIETLELNEKHRLSNIWIGVKSGFDTGVNSGSEQADLKSRLAHLFSEFEYVNVVDIKTAVDEYLMNIDHVL